MPTAPLPLLLAAGLLGGAAAGVGLERAGVLSPVTEPEAQAAAEVRLDRVPVLDCPGGAVVAGLARGDRVVVTGVSGDRAWVEIRSPVDLDRPAWMAAGSVVADRAVDGLPVAECERIPPSTTSSTTTSSTTTTTSTTSSTTTTTTTRPAVDLPPVLRAPDATPRVIVTNSPFGSTQCFVPAGLATTSLVSVVAADDRPGVQVGMSYETSVASDVLGGGPLPVSAGDGGRFTGQLGPLEPEEAALPPDTTVAQVTIVATDASGQQAIATVEVTVRRCEQ